MKINRIGQVNFLLFLIATVLGNLFAPNIIVNAENQEPDQYGVMGGFDPRLGITTDALQAADLPTYVMYSLIFSDSIWSDGKGSLLYTAEVENLSDTPMTMFTWWFSGWDGAHEDVSAIGLSSNKPVTLNVVDRIENGIYYFDVNFHKPISKGERYLFKFRITILGMAHPLGLGWETYWRFQMSGLQDFTQEVAYPANSTITLKQPLPTKQRGNILTWELFSTELNIDLTTKVQFRLSNSNNVTLLYQTDSRWGGTMMGHGPETIGQVGCYITSAAMLINYFSASQGSALRTDPLVLNNWLLQNKGYDSNNNVQGASKFQEYVTGGTANPIVHMYFSRIMGHSTISVSLFL